MKKVAAIVVTYNRKELLRECLQALLAQTIPDLDILLIDNASTDGTKEYITDIVEENPSIRYMNTGSNLGGAGGFHYGLKKAYEMGYDYMWIMDDDTIPYPDALEQLFIADKKLKGRYGFLSSCVLWTDGSYCNMNKPTLDQECSVDEYEMLGQGVIRACRATFVSLLFKRKTIERVGLPLKQYFIWGDDQEYTLRISRRIPSYFVTDSRVVHKMKNNKGSDISVDDYERIDRYELAFRNDGCTAYRNGIMYIISYFELVAYMYKKILCEKGNGYKCKRMWVLTKGFVKGLFFRPQIEYVDEKRKKQNED